MELADSIQDAVRAARRVVVLTGAGMSAESGVPTFREAQTGLWARYDPAELATPGAFARDPQRVWDWYAWRRELVAAATPHAGHRALAEWQAACEVTVVTQNVDGLHQRAGSRDVVELHGSLVRSVCARGCGPAAPAADAGTRPPPCPRCGAALRPDVVWFGETLPEVALERAMDVVPAADLVVSVGTANQVQPAASLPFLALRNDRPVLEVNIEATPLTEAATWHLAATAAEALPGLVAIIRKQDTCTMTRPENRTDAEWRETLSPEAYRVTRQHGTEPPFSGEYNDFKADGVFHCVCCGEPLFDSRQKYDSGSGWPSFWAPADEAGVEIESDHSLGMRRTEAHCRRCRAHLGHVFEDGPEPTGLRYCINSAALDFEAR